jgi:hypothetical protein
LATVVFAVGMAVIYKLGFGQMVATANLRPERLRDFTFPVWHQYPLTKHGFLTFLNADGFSKGEAYANEPTLYLWLMWVLYRIQLIFPSITMRLTGAVIAMSASLLAIGCAIPSSTWSKLGFRRAILLLAAFAYFLTLPTFWISLGKFNVDNVFVLIFPVLVLASAAIARRGPQGACFWSAAGLMCVLMPMTAALFGAFMGLRAVLARRINLRLLRAAVIVVLIAVAVYLQPIIVAKRLHFTSENSTWLFRSGLDGDMQYFGNFFNSVLVPYFNRPAYFVLIPAALLVLQLWWRRRFERRSDRNEVEDYPDAMMPYLFSSYILTLLFWPQAVAIHPYLYDPLLIGPIGAWVVLNFARPEVHERHYLAWLFVLLFLISFNVTKIAQAAHCSSCYFPGWSMRSPQVG